MYAPPAFRLSDLPELHALMRAAPLASLVTATEAGLMASQVPLLLVPGEGPLGTLYGHLARANPQAGAPAQGEALAIFAGADAYVTPSWYASKREHGRVVPTWNYVAVQAHGTIEVFEDEERLRTAVAALTAAQEAGRRAPWAVEDAPEGYLRGQLRGIVGLRMPIARIEGARKMSQNRSAADREGVAEGLSAAGHPAAALVPRGD